MRLHNKICRLNCDICAICDFVLVHTKSARKRDETLRINLIASRGKVVNVFHSAFYTLALFSDQGHEVSSCVSLTTSFVTVTHLQPHGFVSAVSPVKLFALPTDSCQQCT